MTILEDLDAAAGRPAAAPAPPPSSSNRLMGFFKNLRQPRSCILLAVVIVIGYLTLTPLLYLAYGTFVD